MDEDPVTRCLLLQHMTPWLGCVLKRSMAEEIYHTLNMTNRSIFLYRINNGDVELLGKPGFLQRDTFHDSMQGEPDGQYTFREEFIRAKLYREFFARVLAGSPAEHNMLVAVDVNDNSVRGAEYPIFVFQKLAGGNTV